MLQLFFKSSEITQKTWGIAFQRIVSIVHSFPLKLIRIESYDGYSRELDKDHFDLCVEKDTPNEHLSFYGDWTSYTSGTTIKFSRHWDHHQKYNLSGEAVDKHKPITWYPHIPFKDDGALPPANGASTAFGYIDTRGALYEYAIIAICKPNRSRKV